jgi:hypothetical protein
MHFNNMLYYVFLKNVSQKSIHGASKACSRTYLDYLFYKYEPGNMFVCKVDTLYATHELSRLETLPLLL